MYGWRARGRGGGVIDIHVRGVLSKPEINVQDYCTETRIRDDEKGGGNHFLTACKKAAGGDWGAVGSFISSESLPNRS